MPRIISKFDGARLCGERGSVSSRVTLSPSALRTTGLVYPGNLNPISGCAQDYSHGESHPPSSLTPSPLRRLVRLREKAGSTAAETTSSPSTPAPAKARTTRQSASAARSRRSSAALQTAAQTAAVSRGIRLAISLPGSAASKCRITAFIKNLTDAGVVTSKRGFHRQSSLSLQYMSICVSWHTYESRQPPLPTAKTTKYADWIRRLRIF